MAASHRLPCSQSEGRAAQSPAAQSFLRGGPYTRQNAQSNMTTARPNMYGRNGCHFAIATAPETPSKATAQGPMQHRPINEAMALMPIALPLVATSFLSSLIAGSPYEQPSPSCTGGHLTVPYEQKTQQSPDFGRSITPQPVQS